MTTTTTKTKTIYGSAAMAQELGVSRQAFSNWLNRNVGWPTPAFQTPEGLLFWQPSQVIDWILWRRQA